MNFKLINKMKNPTFILKVILISIVFIYEINIEIGVLKDFSMEQIGKDEVNITLFLCHIFSYFEMYVENFFIAFIVLIPDILDRPYLTEQMYVLNKDRNTLFKNTIKLISVFIGLFILWFILLTIIFSLFRLKIFDFSWPSKLMNTMYNKVPLFGMTLIAIPKSAIQLPLPGVFILIISKIFVGFLLIGLASFYVSFKKNNVSYGVGITVALFVISHVLFFCGGGSIFSFVHKFTYNYSLCTFFTFENKGVDFLQRIMHTYIYGGIVCFILLILIKKEINKKDLC